MEETSLIVIGGLNTDIIATGLKQFPKAGEHVYGKELKIGPGGKSRNIAAMAGYLLPHGHVAMIGRTAKDDYGLWKLPVDALKNAGVLTDFVNILSFEEAQKMPAVALIPVNEQGENQIIVLSGVSDDFSQEDINAAQQLFETVSQNNGYLALTLECPFATAKYAIKKAIDMGIKVILDPGGIETDTRIEELLAGLYLIKPNEHEAKMITGIEVIDMDSARNAAGKLRKMGAKNILITHGEQGAYLFTDSTENHIPVPEVDDGGKVKDATGCGDQTVAALCASLRMGKSLAEAAKTAILAGTLQFYKSGIQPITKQELQASV